MPDARYDIDIDIRKKGNGPEAAEAALEAVGNKAQEAGTEADQAGDKMDRSLRDTAKEAKKTEGAFEGFGAKIKSVASGARAALDKLWTSIKVGAAVATGALVGMVKASVDFNQSIARASTMARNTPFSELSRQVKNLSTDLGIAKSELADGLYQALSAGVSEDNVFKFLSTAGKVAVADGSNIATAVDGITTVLNAFKISADQTEKVADMMFATVANGKTTFSDLAANMATVAPTAAASGVELEQVLGAVMTLTAQGVPTAQAMTQIRASILALNDVLGDGWSDIMSFQDGISKVANQSGGSQTRLRELVGSVEALAGFMALSGENASKAQGDIKKAADAVGEVSKAQEKMDDFKGWAKLKHELSNWAIGIGTAFHNVLEGPVAAITDQLVKWREDEGIFKKLEDRLFKIKDTIEAAYKYMQKGPEQMDKVWGAVGQLLLAYIQKGGELAAQVILRYAPVIGEAIGAAVKGLFVKDPGLKAAEKAARERVYNQFKEEGRPIYGPGRSEYAAARDDAESAARRQYYSNQGSELSGSFVSTADAHIASAKANLANIAEEIKQESVQAAESVGHVVRAWKVVSSDAAESVSAGIDEVSESMRDSGEKVAEAAEEAKDAVTETANAAEGELNQASATVVAATEAATGKIGGGIERLGGVVAQGFESNATAIAKIAAATESQINAIAARLQATEAALVANASRTSTLESQVKNMRA